jgi:hypothetical protein
VLLAEDNTSVALILKALRAQGFTGPVFADQGGAGTGGTSTVGPAGAAAEGFLAGMQADTVSTNNPDVEHWRSLAKASGKPEPRAASRCRPTASSGRSPNWSSAWARHVLRELHQDRRGLKSNPIKLGSIPDIECGPLPDGHTCAVQAASRSSQAASGPWSSPSRGRSDNRSDDLRSPCCRRS